MSNTYDEYIPTISDRSNWTLPYVLNLRASTHKNSVYLEIPDSNIKYTFGEIYDQASLIGSGLLNRGHEFGDRIAIMMPNRAEYILGWFGCGLAGLAEVPINTAYRGPFLEHQIRTVCPTGLIVHDSFVDRFVESADACSSFKKIYLVGDEQTDLDVAMSKLKDAGFDTELFSDLLLSERVKLPSVSAKDLASVFFTSGTTGLSKGVTMTHAHMFFEADECVSLTRLTDRDCYMSVGPLFHGNAQFLAAYPALLAGAKFVLHKKFSASRWSKWILDSGATVTNFVGVMMDFVWKQEPSSEDSMNKLRCIFAAPTASSIVDGFKKRFGIERFVEVFGLTETSMPIMTPYDSERPAGAVGKAVSSWFDVLLANPETDEEVADGELGELLVRPRFPFTMTVGYFGMPEKTTEALRNCWFHTGDGLRRDGDGWYYFVDRLKDSIRKRGENISSYEVEQAILQNESIKECAVIAVPAEQEAGEDEVMAFLVPVPGKEISPAEVWEYCERNLPYFAIPRYLRFINELPKTPSEKVQKAILRESGKDLSTHDLNLNPL